MSDYIPQVSDVGTLATGTFSGYFIQLGERSKADHVVIADGKGGCYEATPSGVRHCSLEEYKDHPILWDERRLKTPEQRAIGIAICEQYLNTRYMWRACVIIALGILHIPVPKFFCNDMEPNEGLICSELGTLVLRGMGFDLNNVVKGTPAWKVYPSEIEFNTMFLR